MIRQTICQETPFSCNTDSTWYKCCKDSKYNCSMDSINTIGEIKCCMDSDAQTSNSMNTP